MTENKKDHLICVIAGVETWCGREIEPNSEDYLMGIDGVLFYMRDRKIDLICRQCRREMSETIELLFSQLGEWKHLRRSKVMRERNIKIRVI